MKRGRLVAFGAGLAVVAAQAGHLLAYQLRFGAAALQVQATGAHAYLPAVLKTVVGVSAGFVLVSLLVVGLARLVAGRRIETDAPPSLMRLTALLFSAQLAIFVLQEIVEGVVAGQAASPGSLILWGAAGQLPAAVLAAVALRWLGTRLGPAVAELRTWLAPTIQVAPRPLALVMVPVAPRDWTPAQAFIYSFNRRGPPL